MKTKNKRTYNFKFYPTKLLQEIINACPYYTCNNGYDYTDYIHDIKIEFWTRENKNNEKRGKK